MKILFPLFTVIVFLYACGDNAKPATHIPAKNSTSIFPVTDYLRGEIFTIKQNGVNPLKYTIQNNRSDSVWIKVEELDSTVAEFLHPQIDSAGMLAFFTGESFKDQSLNAVTFTYDAKPTLPDSIKLKHCDVYIDPKTSKVKRVYMVKQPDKTKTLQLTWVNGQWCKIVTIANAADGSMKVEKEEKLVWDF